MWLNNNGGMRAYEKFTVVMNKNGDGAIFGLNTTTWGEIGICRGGRAIDHELVPHGDTNDGGRHGRIGVRFLLRARRTRHMGHFASDIGLMQRHIRDSLALIRDMNEQGKTTGNAVVAEPGCFGDAFGIGSGSEVR